MKIILASNSPRRKVLMKKITSDFVVIPATSPENSDAVDACRYATELATHKATEVSSTHADAIVIGCDTVVDLDGKVLGKPKDASDAIRMLHQLSDKTHCVHTGVCIVYGDKKVAFCQTTKVTFRKLSDQDIRRYVDSGLPLDKAGAYGIQECDFVKSYDGSYDNIVGFPTERVQQGLTKFYKG